MPKYKQYLNVVFKYKFTLEDRQSISKAMELDHLANVKDCSDFIDDGLRNQFLWLGDELNRLESDSDSNE